MESFARKDTTYDWYWISFEFKLWFAVVLKGSGQFSVDNQAAIGSVGL